MVRAAWWLVVLVACDGGGASVSFLDDPETDVVDTPETDEEESDPPDPVEESDPPDTVEESDPPEEETEEPEVDPYEGATLIVDQPLSGSLHNDADPAIDLRARVVATNGRTYAFSDLHWKLVGPGNEIFVGTSGSATIAYGVHNIEVSARLPNGDSLRTTVGAVRIQHPATGIYAGSSYLNGTSIIDGNTVPVACFGSVVLTVPMDGSALRGDGSCAVNLVVIPPFDLTFDVDAALTYPAFAGTLNLDAGFVPLPVDLTGRYVRAGQVTASFSGLDFSLFNFSYSMEGEIEANRVSLYVNP